MEAREKMHNAATCAGLGFGNAMAAMAHAMGHSLGGAFHVPHGRAVSLFLPGTIEFAAVEAPERYAELAVFAGCSKGKGEKAARELADGIRGLCRGIGSPTSVSELEIERKTYESKLDKLMDEARDRVSAIVCAERLPWRCHRRFIARELEKRGWKVNHVLDKERSWIPKVNAGPSISMFNL